MVSLTLCRFLDHPVYIRVEIGFCQTLAISACVANEKCTIFCYVNVI